MIAVLASLLFSLVSLIGALALLLPRSAFNKTVPLLVALAAGAMLGGAFFHLLPEAVSELGNTSFVWIMVAASFLLFFVLEQFLHWHHCHRSPLEHHPVGYNLLAAGSLHSLLEGVAVGALLAENTGLGLLALLLVSAHEVPQSLGDFGALVHSGWSPRRALFWNWLSALAFLPGALLGTFFIGDPTWMLPLVAGSFLYVGAADLLPQLRSKEKLQQALQFLFLVIGLLVLALL